MATYEEDFNAGAMITAYYDKVFLERLDAPIAPSEPVVPMLYQYAGGGETIEGYIACR